MKQPVLFLDACPVCSQGLVRVRTRKVDKHYSGLCVCDECDAAWDDPSLTQRVARDSLTEESIWGDSTHWATIEEICLFGWYPYIQPKKPKSTKSQKPSHD